MCECIGLCDVSMVLCLVGGMCVGFSWAMYVSECLCVCVFKFFCVTLIMFVCGLCV